MGNCDTHVFLGSNSFKTVEYFSKALGEKTITRENLSVNRDKQFHRQGYSDSDQVMARALMTPDELRRMDNDLCIIYEKGIKPVKARKYYYFETPMAKKLAEYSLNHLEFDIGNRGEWRKYNPYNPYQEEKKDGGQDLKIESLDDLFEDKTDSTANKEDLNVNEKNLNQAEAPTLPQAEDRKEDDILSVDVQKQLEAKFDELFGPFDDEDTIK